MYQTKWTEKLYLGTRKKDRKRIYISAPLWSFNRYWSFGYVGNKIEQYQLSSCAKEHHKNWHDALRTDYQLNVKLEGRNLWKFCELAKTAYTLKEAAQIYEVGSLYYSRNDIINVIINPTEVERINKVVLPKIFDEIYEMFTIGENWETYWRVK